MIQAVNGEIAKLSRQLGKTTGSGRTQWRTDYIGIHEAQQVEDRPQAFLAEMLPNTSNLAHFHQVDEFQVIVAGNGTLGRNAVPPITLHYVDHHTAYGPINAGPSGLAFFTIRAQSDPGAIHLHKPGHKDFLRPTKRRYLLAERITLSSAPVLQSRSEVLLDNVFVDADCSDGLGAYMLRLGADMNMTGPDPKATAGQYYLVVNGVLQLGGVGYPAWSLVYVSPSDAPLDVHAGASGLEALILNFPRAKA